MHRRNVIRGNGNRPTILPTAPNWKAYAEMNARRVAKYGQDAFISAEDYAQLWADSQRPKPVTPPMSRAAVEAIQNWFYQHNREPLTAREILDLTGVGMENIKARLDRIDSEYKAQVAAQLGKVEEMKSLGIKLPADIERRATDDARAAHTREIKLERESFLESVAKVRDAHAPLRHQVRKNISPPIDDATRQHMTAALRGLKTIADVKAVWNDAAAAGDAAACAFIEQHAREFLPETQRDGWNGNNLALTRAGDAWQKIQDDEKAIDDAFSELRHHITFEERSAMAATLRIDEKYLPEDGLIADLRLPPAQDISVEVAE